MTSKYNFQSLLEAHSPLETSPLTSTLRLNSPIVSLLIIAPQNDISNEQKRHKLIAYNYYDCFVAFNNKTIVIKAIHVITFMADETLELAHRTGRASMAQPLKYIFLFKHFPLFKH